MPAKKKKLAKTRQRKANRENRIVFLKAQYFAGEQNPDGRRWLGALKLQRSSRQPTHCFPPRQSETSEAEIKTIDRASWTSEGGKGWLAGRKSETNFRGGRENLLFSQAPKLVNHPQSFWGGGGGWFVSSLHRRTVPEIISIARTISFNPFTLTLRLFESNKH